MPQARSHVKVVSRFPEISEAMIAVIVDETGRSGTRIEQDVKGGPNSLYRKYPEKPTYKRTGNLGRSYHRDRVKVTKSMVTCEVGNDPDVADYVVHVEYGTVHMEAEPHLRPAVEHERLVFQTNLIVRMRTAALAKGLNAVKGLL